MSAPKCIFEESQYDLIREAARQAGEVLHLVGNMVKPGVSPLELDAFAESWILERGSTPTFKGYHGFPNTLCISVNENIVHGIPVSKALNEGDIVSIDVGVTITEQFRGQDFQYVGDNAFTFPCGVLAPKLARLLKHTNEGLWAGIDAIEAGKKISDIASAIEKVSSSYRYGSVKEYGGHGIGPSYHCEPFIPNYSEFFQHFQDTEIQVGMVLAIEPMFNLGSSNVKKHKDGWTISTVDRKASAHFEHSVLVLEDRVEVITNTRNTREYFSEF
jgi:methionyl aminopeptidase